MTWVIEFLSEPPWQRLALTLLHFLWQGLAATVLVIAAVRLLKLRHGPPRYAAYLVAMLTMAACPVVTCTLLGEPSESSGVQAVVTEPRVLPAAPLRADVPRHAETAGPPVLTAEAAVELPTPEQKLVLHPPRQVVSGGDGGARYLSACLPWVLMVWLAGVGVLSVRLLTGLAGAHRWRRRLQAVPGDLAQVVAAMCERMGLRGFARVFISPLVPQAMAIGLLRPMILLPVAIMTQMSPEMLEAVIAHELAHIRRLDLWVNLLQRLMETLFFYHPAVWWLSTRLRGERELCCDEAAVAATGKRLTYASTLERAYATGLEAAQPVAAAGLGAEKMTTLGRVRHVLGLRHPTGRKPGWLAGLITIAAVVVLAAGVQLSGLAEELRTHHTTEVLPQADDEHSYVAEKIRLIGVRPDGGDELFDPDGKLAGTLPDYAGRHAQWAEHEIPRDFIFELPKTDQPIHFIGPVQAFPDGRRRNLDLGFVKVAKLPDGRQRAVLPMTLRRTYRRWYRDKSVRRVNLTLRYYIGRRGPAECVFTGPFEPGKTITGDAGEGYRLTTVKPKGVGEAGVVRFTVQVDKSMHFGVPLIVYDSKGGWHLAQYAGGGRSDKAMTLQYRVRGLTPDRVIRVAFNERPRGKVFRNIVVRYRKRARRSYAAYIDEIASRLDIKNPDPKKIRNRPFKTPAEAIKCIDVVRGYAVYQAWQAIRDLKPKLKREDLDERQLKRVRDAARAWLTSSDGRTRAYAVQLGLQWGKWPEFVQPALQLLDDEYHIARGDAARALYTYRTQLSAEHIRQIKERLLAKDDARTHGDLSNCLMNNRNHPEAVRAVWELAESDNVWLWWPAVDTLISMQVVKKSVPLSDRLRRRLVAQGRTHLVPDAGRFETEAYRLLSGLLTPKLVQTNVYVFNQVLHRMLQHVDREKNSAVLMRFLERLLEEWDDHKVEGRASSNPGAVDRVVRHLNHWHGVNIGGLGGDIIQGTRNRWGFDWKAIAAEAVRWHQTGVDPGKLPAGWKPQDGDLRIVWVNKTNPDLSVIAVWTRPVAPETPPTWTALDFADDFLNYHITATGGAGRYAYVVRMKTGVIQHHATSKLSSFGSAQLPVNIALSRHIKGSFDGGADGVMRPTVRWLGTWEVWVEPLAAAKSVLAGTELFGNWKTQYLKTLPLSEPRPRVFFRHPRDVVKQYVLKRRSYEGWSEAEVALRLAMDTDCNHRADDLRDFGDAFSQQGAIDAWKRFLERTDITDAHRVFACWRIACLCAFNYSTERGEKARYAEAAAAFAKAMNIMPDLVSRETIHAAGCRASLGGTPEEQCTRLAEAYRWYATRTQKMFRDGARRTNKFGNLLNTRYRATLPAPEVDPSELKARAGRLKHQVSERKTDLEGRITRHIIRSRRRELISTMLESLEDVAPAEVMTKWRRLSGDVREPTRPVLPPTRQEHGN